MEGHEWKWGMVVGAGEEGRVVSGVQKCCGREGRVGGGVEGGFKMPAGVEGEQAGRRLAATTPVMSHQQHHAHGIEQPPLTTTGHTCWNGSAACSQTLNMGRIERLAEEGW